MTTRYLLLAAAAICLAMAPATGQSPSMPGGYAVKKCDDPKVPIGVLPKGLGTVSYLLGKNGKPDTASIAVLKVFGLSVAGFRSVSVRELSACNLDMGTPAPTAPVGVVQEIGFADSSSIDVGVATASAAPGTPLAVEPLGLPKDAFPMPIEDRRIEERPRRLSCKPPQLPQIRASASGRSRADAQAQMQVQVRIAMEQWNDFNAGTLVGQVRVGIDGKPGTQIKVIEVSNPSAAQNLAELIAGCRFVPGRYHGVLVPAFVETKIGIVTGRVP